jgi:hypothetical protein
MSNGYISTFNLVSNCMLLKMTRPYVPGFDLGTEERRVLYPLLFLYLQGISPCLNSLTLAPLPNMKVIQIISPFLGLTMPISLPLSRQAVSKQSFQSQIHNSFDHHHLRFLCALSTLSRAEQRASFFIQS